MNEDFIYKHAGLIPWIITSIWTFILALAFKAFPVESTLSETTRMFVFGASWWFIFQSLDERVSEYRRRVLFKNPDLKNAYILTKLAEWDAADNEHQFNHKSSS